MDGKCEVVHADDAGCTEDGTRVKAYFAFVTEPVLMVLCERHIGRFRDQGHGIEVVADEQPVLTAGVSRFLTDVDYMDDDVLVRRLVRVFGHTEASALAEVAEFRAVTS